MIAGADMDDRVSKAPMGTRYQCVIVEINDDETPRDHKAEERDKWRALGATKQAGIRCKEPTFWAFLVEEMNCCAWSEAEAAEAVRDICRVASRADLDKPGHSLERVRWFDLDNQYQAWRIRENG
ncbi:hypothetical protein [Bradyrhizobium sp. AZCC 2176]|uniref:hypothetical protein n=2 Tax=unclassified Bradyrhizobium TaxID=2631580 RepID=UPI002FF3D853